VEIRQQPVGCQDAGQKHGEGEHLPYCTGSFDYVLMMPVICFLPDPLHLFRKAFRVSAPGGELIVGFPEREGEIT